MKIAFYNIYQEFNYDDYIFTNHNSMIGDNLLTPFVKLKEFANLKNIEVGTTDKISIEEADKIVFLDMPRENDEIFLKAIDLKKDIYLIGLESPIIHPSSYDKTKHTLFNKVFTLSDDLVNQDKEKYIKINYSYEIPKNISSTKKEKFCCMIAGNKSAKFKNELYSKRKEAIHWFEEHAPQDFDLYGLYWNEGRTYTSNRYINFLYNKFPFIRKIAFKKYKTYKGKVARKKPILEKYKFSICFENAYGTNGYITEKIFDCLFSGCIPIYLGAANIEAHIPKSCFIDMRNFSSMEQLYKYLKNMPDNEYDGYLNGILNFLNSKEIENFSIELFARTIINTIINEGVVNENK